jgi:phage terminase large subunit-like protein
VAARQLTRAERNIVWIEEFCRVPEGKDIGKRIKLRPWQKRDLRKIYDNPHGTRLAIISFGKKNGKTALAACLLLLHLVGPEAEPNTQLPSTAQSREQASVLFNLAAKIVRMSPDLDAHLVIRDSAKQIYCPDLGTLYKALSADASTAHGQSPKFAIHDELGQVRGPISELYNAIENAMGAHEAPMSVIISTQAPTDADLLSILIDDAKTGLDPTIVLSLYTADPDLDPFSTRALKQANPALGDFLNASEIHKQAKMAKRIPSQEALYRNYTLNQRIDVNSPFISREVWKANGGAVGDWGQAPIYAGLDLSSSADLTAFVPIALIDETWEVDPTFWLPREGLAEKSRADRVPYDQWAKAGLLETTPGRAIEYEFVAHWLYRFDTRRNVVKIAFDRWGMKHLRPWLIKAGFKEQRIDDLFEGFGQGFQSMSPALREVEAALLKGNIRHGNHPVLTMCASNAVVTMDPAGNRKLDKAKAAGRIDGMVALTMAFGVAPMDASSEPSIDEWLKSLA